MRDPAPATNRYTRQVRLASEIASLGTAAILLASAALPTMDEGRRVGLFVSAVLLTAFALVWFHILPEAALGRQRFTAGTVIVQLISGFLLLVTGGVDSPYFLYYALPMLASTFAVRVTATVATASVAAIGFIAIGLVHPDALSDVSRDVMVVRFFALLSVGLVAVLIARTMERTRSTLRRRSAELADHNRELEVARSLNLTLARLRERGDIIRAVYDAAHRAIGTDRLWLFLDQDDDFASGSTMGAAGLIESYTADPSRPNAPRLRAIREHRAIMINDSAAEDAVTERARNGYGLRSGIFVPLVHHSRTIGVIAFTSSAVHEWTALEVRLAETIAEGSAAGIATQIAFEELRDERAQLARRTRVLEGLATLSDALAMAPNDEAIAATAVRNLVQSFELRAATVLFTDASLALLEPRAASADASAHDVVMGPDGCPALRGGRFFRVASANAPVLCPHMPYREGTRGFACMPLVAAGQTVGALFLEPSDRSTIDEGLVRAASDRVALTAANLRVLETAQRQAVTDGLTGLYNRHFMAEQLRLLHSLATRHERPFSVIALDVDQLKRVNDTHGHEAGDLALRGLANVLKRTLRSSDIAVRTGGDEFLVLLPDTALHEAAGVAERARAALEAQALAEPNTAITISAGVSSWRPGQRVEEVLERADAMLYQAKRAGRDRVAAEKIGA